MKTIKNILSWLIQRVTRPTRYDPQILSSKQLTLIEEFDSALASKYGTTSSIDTFLHVNSTRIPLVFQHMSINKLLHTLTRNLPDNAVYIPRNIAFMTDANGDWNFYYALRKNEPGDSIILAELFLDALTRTNNARS